MTKAVSNANQQQQQQQQQQPKPQWKHTDDEYERWKKSKGLK